MSRIALIMMIIVASTVGCAHTKKMNSKANKAPVKKSVAQSSAQNSKQKNKMIQAAQSKNQFQKKNIQTAQADLVGDLTMKSEGVYYAEIITAMDKRKYPMALKSINEVLEKNPNSKRAPRYLFLKTKAYAQMNLVPQAKSVLAELQKKYPNTVEAKMAHGWVTQ